MKEEWKVVPGYKNYEVSNYGEIRSTKRKELKKLNQYFCKDNKRYKYVYLYPDRNRGEPAKRSICLVHRLVLATFNRPPKTGEECNHKDGIKENNCLSNLEWVTKKENTKHAVDNALYQRGAERPTARLNVTEIHRIRKLAENGVQLKKIAKHFGVNPSHISRIVNRKKWRHF